MSKGYSFWTGSGLIIAAVGLVLIIIIAGLVLGGGGGDEPVDESAVGEVD